MPIPTKLPSEDVISSTFWPDQNIIAILDADDKKDGFSQFVIGDTSKMIYHYSLLAGKEFLLIETCEQEEEVKWITCVSFPLPQPLS